MILFQIREEMFTPLICCLDKNDYSTQIVMALAIVVSCSKLMLQLEEEEWQVVCRCLLLPAKQEQGFLDEINNQFHDKE